MSIAVLGAGAFGAALAVTLAQQGPVTLWARDGAAVETMRATRQIPRLPGVTLPETVRVTADLAETDTAGVVLLALPMQALGAFLADHPRPNPALVACCKGIDLATGRGPSALIAETCPNAQPAVLTGPSFAADIARGLPTALTLACADAGTGAALQLALSTPTLRLYRSTDVTGAELGGALKNVIAIAAGVTMGAGLGDSARAALMTRGFAEMNRLAAAMGARPETLAGLSGLGDLVLTCTSAQSRNYRYGHALGAGETFDPRTTVEGAATAGAAAAIAAARGLEMPVTEMVAALVARRIGVEDAMAALLARPLKEE
ncbi:NAD(P)H-dependent glycerol-3-phosphate dehydrogenase [Phaeovulum vinaykumarii]|uniref:Glycerol-3-phosphate dehydrogenase [NAD(P)+] n=1 Tax=Phaeovulum vinaykumarii TaxID=407234 RepID=A0A1N7MA61_9RHOB|nr:NAD(P)H-dependent glycerol-3-phosphate dehydrogenase [Phaeovulum vinaykumarii]SIS82957.1 glycerol-3-phosphate dehydrogenase (NAD(P)+) [Phaeovulum vinaykumarii]SOC10527.1 glycerol-3-phosphate dehydrogenase (NAD(P)+) [Phaeovulum vinaykumarii]